MKEDQNNLMIGHCNTTKNSYNIPIVESFYYVNCGLSIIMSKVCQINSVKKT